MTNPTRSSPPCIAVSVDVAFLGDGTKCVVEGIFRNSMCITILAYIATRARLFSPLVEEVMTIL